MTSLIRKSLFFILIWIITACSDTQPNENNATHTSPKRKAITLKLNHAEKEYIANLKERGGLRIATELYRSTYHPKPDGSIQGFQYRLAKAFTEHFKLKLNIKVVDEWNSLFYVNGKFPEESYTDPKYRRTPDLFKEVDVYVCELTELPWRKKLFDYVRILPSRMILVNRKGEEINKLHEMIGKRVATTQSTSFHDRFEELEKSLNTKFDYLFALNTTDHLNMLERKEADLAAADANYVILDFPNHPQLTASLPITPIQYIGWGVARENKPLSSLLKKYIEFIKENGTFDNIWKSEHGITYPEYLQLLE